MSFAWRLIEGFFLVLGPGRFVKRPTLFIVPDQFVTDFASVPRIFWTLIPPATGRHVRGAVLHDWLYYTGLVSKLEADQIFYDALIQTGVPKIKAYTMYASVKWFAGFAWKNHRTKNHSLKTWLEKHARQSLVIRTLHAVLGDVPYERILIRPLTQAEYKGLRAFAESDDVLDLQDLLTVLNI